MPSLSWLENDGQQNFTRRRIAYSPSNLATIAVGDLDGDKRPDIVAGGLHIPGPMGRHGRVTAWLNKGTPVKGNPPSHQAVDSETPPREHPANSGHPHGHLPKWQSTP